MRENNTKLVMILLDGFRFDYLNPDLMPNLMKISTAGFSTKLETLLGYSSGIHPSIWTGAQQRSHGEWTKYFLQNRNSSLFRNIFYHTPSVFLRYVIKYLLKFSKPPSARGRVDDLLPGMPACVSPYFSPQPWSIGSPYEYPKYFSKSQLGISTLWDVLAENHAPNTYSFCRDSTSLLAEVQRERNRSELDFFLLTSLDELGHTHGPFSSEMNKELRQLDIVLSRLIDKQNSDSHVILFSDHGMTTISSTVDVQKLLNRSGLLLGKDYIVFHDSTLSRFWPTTDSARKTLRQVLNESSFGKVLTPSDLKMFGVDFKGPARRKFGEMIFLVKPGLYIYPNFLHSIKANHMKAAHGYDPRDYSSLGVFVYIGPLSKNFGALERMTVLDILPTILSILGLPKPMTCEGVSALLASPKKFRVESTHTLMDGQS